METFIFSEIVKSYWHNGKQAPLYYYRDRDQREIDLLIVQDNTAYPLEFKKTAAPHQTALRSFHVLDKLHLKRGEGGVICLTNTLLPITSLDQAIPVYIL